MTELIIIGASGSGKDVYQVIHDINVREKKYQVIGFIDSNPDLGGSKSAELPVLGDVDYLARKNQALAFACGIGRPANKYKMIRQVISLMPQADWPVLIHPSALVSSSAKIGRGVIVCAQCVIQPDAVIEEFTLLNIATIVGHDSSIGPFGNLNPRTFIAGNCQIGGYFHAGAGTVVIDHLRVGNHVHTAAGSVVVADVVDDIMVAGHPARLVRPPAPLPTPRER